MSGTFKNIHKAKRLDKRKVEQLIASYPERFPTPKYLSFMHTMLCEGWDVKIYVAKVSKYVFVRRFVKDIEHVYKIRFSNHRPIYEKQLENDCDFYVGISHGAVHTTDAIIKILIERVK